MKLFNFYKGNSNLESNLQRSSDSTQAEELISNPTQIYRYFHKAVGIKTRQVSSLAKCPFNEYLGVWLKVISSNNKLEPMQDALNKFFVAWTGAKVFSDSEIEKFKSRVSKESFFEDKLGIFALTISDKLAQYFDTGDSTDKNFFGGVQNQISTTMSLIKVSFDNLMESQHSSDENLRSKLMNIVKNLDSILYGFSKTQFQTLRKVFNLLGYSGNIPPTQFQYGFNKNYFGFDSKEDPSRLLPKKKLVKDLKFWSRYFPFYREGRRLNLIKKSIPAFGCPALAIKAPNGDNFIKVIHAFICESFEKAFLPNLDKAIRLESS